jgi:NAD+ synthase
MKNLKEQIILWLRKQVKEAKAKGLIIGLSGGIDSSVVGVLAKEAVGNKVLGLILPCHTAKKELEDVRLVVEKFKIKNKVIALTSVYDLLIKLLPRGDHLAQGNLKPRLRMLTLYYFANKLNYLVVGTGNKTELMVGYFTKYGDGGVDLLPLGNLYKSEVRKLAEDLCIPKKVIYKTPTAGLWEGQTDEGEMGISYPELDKILAGLEKGESRMNLWDKKVGKIKLMVKKSKHKRGLPKIFYQ